MSRRLELAIGWPLAIAAIALFVGLGRWQLARMHEKQAMLDASRQVVSARKDVGLGAASDPARQRAYDWAAGDGRFAEAPPVLLDNQQRGGRTGVRAYRVFEPAGAAPLLVDLGWLPLGAERRMPAIPRPGGTLRVAGLLSPPPSPGIATAGVEPQPGGALLAVSLRIPVLRAALELPRLAPRVLRLDPALPLGYARDLDVLSNTLPPQRHLGYAVQWFAMALAVLAILLLLTFRRARR